MTDSSPNKYPTQMCEYIDEQKKHFYAKHRKTSTIIIKQKTINSSASICTLKTWGTVEKSTFLFNQYS